MGGPHVSHACARTGRCWECEGETDAPRTVILRTDRGDVGTLSLCPACYRACYLLLAPDASGALLVESVGEPCRPTRPSAA
jgi:hypothetical protein